MRLHVTPLTSELLPTVLGPSLTKSAQNISFQTLATFPENSYGFFDLQEADAKKLISKVNGAFLKGRKMKVEEARPKKRLHTKLDKDESPAPEPAQKKPKRDKKAGTELNVTEGHELSAGRKVKRGWTEPKSEKATRSKTKEKGKDSKPQAPSQYSEKAELLFRTKLPPNKEGLKADKKRKRSAREGAEPALVHEFEKTQIQPSFLRETISTQRSAEYVDNIGWVNGQGDVVEKESSSRQRMRAAKPTTLHVDTVKSLKSSPKTATADETSSSGSSVTTESLLDEPIQDVEDDAENTSSSGTTSPDVETDPATAVEEEKERVTESVPDSTQLVQEVHPLEALFKKPMPPKGQDSAKPSLEIETSFSFFKRNTPDDDQDTDDHSLPPEPLTPFTSQETRSRGLRSAAPTPDTAHPSRFPSFTSALSSLDETTSTNSKATPSKSDSKSSQSEFEKRFWAERGQNNRAWKARSRAAKKEQRQKDNRSRRGRGPT
ncbi:hypothetical protein LTR64_007298 [Lithohypha guttulata]|uniref:uncharacterized protein n=1 Tax=Lithohypha guttulata TaxID=1690604 RepID=UPI00315D8014